MKILQPSDWEKPKGYSNGVSASGHMVFVAGMVGWNPVKGEFEHEDFVGQWRQALENTVAVLHEGGAEPRHIVRMTAYITDKQEYLANLKDVGRAYRDVIGRHFPAMAMVQVSELIEDKAKVEIETTAVISGASGEAVSEEE